MIEAKKPSPLEENLRVLTDEIGGRMAGTPAMKQAVDWGVSAFNAAGADTVAVEPFTIETSWQEGNTQIQIVSPDKFNIHARSFGWSPALVTNTPVRVVDIGDGSPEAFKKAGDISGAVVLLHSNPNKSWGDLFGEYLHFAPVADRAVAGKAAAIAVMSTHQRDLMYRHIHAGPHKLDDLPVFLVAREDAQRIARVLTKNKNVAMNINMPNKIGPAVTTWNVIAEIKGSEKPNEWVLLGAHLDSWELGTGALDNGCNAALVIDALRAIKASGIKPKRSIRFALFSGEEQGLIGSHTYVAAHHDEMKNGAAVVIFDGGSGAVTGFSLGGRKDIASNIKKLLTPLQTYGVKTHTADASVGTDNIDFLLEGIPNLTANQKEANYLDNYHAQSDTFDKVDLKQLRNNVIVAATTVFAIADAPNHPGKRYSINETDNLLKKTKLDDQMKLFHIWNYWTEIKAKREKA